MKFLKILNTRPSPENTKRIPVISLVAVVAFYAVMGWLFLLSGDETNVMASQLSFSGTFLTNQYATIIAKGGMDAYRAAQALDYGFMVSYSCLIFSLALKIGRKFDEDDKWRTGSQVVALLGIAAGACDAVENGFIFATLQTPASVPDVLAIAHSSFALVKWILLLSAIIWAIFAAVALKTRKE
ncbi:MAG: hypothetical protein ACTSU5_13290 [Promethearchaeota archaeon]